jgi:hypothetical protein
MKHSFSFDVLKFCSLGSAEAMVGRLSMALEEAGYSVALVNPIADTPTVTTPDGKRHLTRSLKATLVISPLT